jgi:hypothetical protein
MGFFSRKTRVYVSSTAYQLGETDPDAVATNTLLAIYSQTPISAVLKNMVLSGMSNKVKLARKYAKETYTLGLPSGNFKAAVEVADSTMATVIATDIGYPLGVVVDHTTVEPLIPYHLVRDYLYNTRGWDEVKNTISVLPPATLPTGPAPDKPTSYTCVLTDFVPNAAGTVATITYTVTCWQDSFTNNYIGSFPTGRGDILTAQYRWGWSPGIFATLEVTESFTLPIGYIIGKEHYIVRYKKITTDGFDPTMRTWYYAVGNKTYPVLDNAIDVPDAFSGLPVIPIRYDNVDLCSVAKQDTDLYKTSKVLLDKLGINILDIADAINTNESSPDIDHAYVMFGIDMQTVEQSSITYLVHFFDKLADKAIQSGIVDRSQIATAKAVLQKKIIYHKDSYTIINQHVVDTESVSLVEHGLDIRVSYNWIISELRVGNIGTVEKPAKEGFATKDYVRQGLSNDYVRTNMFAFNRSKWDKSRLILKLQITDNIYQYVEVEGLQQSNLIYQNKSVYTTLTNVIDDPDEHNLIIPVDYNIAMNLGILKRNALYEESLQLVMNSVKFVKEKWYQTGWFRVVSFIVMAIIIYLSWGTLSPAIAGAFASLQAFVQFVVMSIILGAAMKAGFSWLASQIGAEWMAIIGVAVAAISIYMGQAHPMAHSVGTAQMCLKMSISLIEAGTIELQNEIEDIGQEYDQFLLTSSEQVEKLQAAQELLIVDPLGGDLLYAQTNRFNPHPLSGSPEMFYALTIHTGNIGTVVLDIIPQYHTIALTLPTVEESTGLQNYGMTV